ncbi:hypothetical protein CYMTET_15477 [Cymbomonas tetramitiformis]|uniref:S-adenosyl-L-methionine-dependent methyltransferase n=1 Tax=Cymbomonas tetramitiformis TaxID=36881 RepID=A0AAE0GE93_9CHLO|nr:hypothetical protein CYMTET_15477 [Cymbomonas tetramitiformis]
MDVWRIPSPSFFPPKIRRRNCTRNARTLSRRNARVATTVRAELPKDSPSVLQAGSSAATSRSRVHTAEVTCGAVGEVLFKDDYAATLASLTSLAVEQEARDLTAFDLDEALVSRALDMALEQSVRAVSDYSMQIVLLGPGLDTRSVRIPWPSNIVIFDIIPEAAADLSSPFLRKEVRKKGCTYRPVRMVDPDTARPVGSSLDNADESWVNWVAVEDAAEDLESRLMAAGYQPQRPSIWAVQRRRGMCGSPLSMEHGL